MCDPTQSDHLQWNVIIVQRVFQYIQCYVISSITSDDKQSIKVEQTRCQIKIIGLYFTTLPQN